MRRAKGTYRCPSVAPLTTEVLNDASKKRAGRRRKSRLRCDAWRKLCSCVHALFLEVMAVKADQPCSTFLLPQRGQTMFSFSCSATVRIFENVFLQA
jgi:hypothetical protein